MCRILNLTFPLGRSMSLRRVCCSDNIVQVLSEDASLVAEGKLRYLNGTPRWCTSVLRSKCSASRFTAAACLISRRIASLPRRRMHPRDYWANVQGSRDETGARTGLSRHALSASGSNILLFMIHFVLREILYEVMQFQFLFRIVFYSGVIIHFLHFDSAFFFYWGLIILHSNISGVIYIKLHVPFLWKIFYILITVLFYYFRGDVVHDQLHLGLETVFHPLIFDYALSYIAQTLRLGFYSKGPCMYILTLSCSCIPIILFLIRAWTLMCCALVFPLSWLYCFIYSNRPIFRRA